MARTIVWTSPAWDDLDAAAEYIARDSAFYAASFVAKVREAAESLVELAERGQVVPEFQDPEIREFLVRPYRLIYRVEAEHVTILALVHGARRSLRI